MPRNSFSATEPYPVTAPGSGRGVIKDRWTRSYRDVQSSLAGFMGSRQLRRRDPERRAKTDSPIIRALNSTNKGAGKTGALTNPPYSIHSSKKIVRDAVKAWRKRIMKENANVKSF